MVLFGCGQSNFTGTFIGNTAITRGSNTQEQLTFTLQETNGAVTGTWSSNLGSTGNVSGFANGSNLSNFQMTIPEGQGNCAGTLTGTGGYANFILTVNFGFATTRCGTLSNTVLNLTRVNR
jgi:hypothetical protein